ncbi:NAD(P)H-binding protein [Herbiconiux sp. KACC 21604]|uniref:NAD-dependent epimerase/dehydratase family protein n=1 Tax=unclassified Herbiconiux TaxID=2618217 RepID=UPI001492F70D|nr:NAD(P)H-binding protein [Herbiconiux sp. SALV-R1]QJU53378.1 NAD(P)H-binding protein [Herbiconiux sp. SALV-R1]WPO88342.1 NAD(P)H-binding protein [Herbiconiux sp. KACC 21604]
MRIAITGGTGFVGRHLAGRLDPAETVVVSRRTGTEIDDVDALTAAFEGCDAVAHCAGINREIGDQTFQRVHVDGTRAVIEAARRAGVKRIVLLSFLRARPGTGSGYHETKWQAEELVRASGLEHTVLKSGMIYGRGDHMVDHVTRAVRTFPVFALVGRHERRVRPVPVADAIDVLIAALEGRITEPTVAVMGAETLELGAAVRRIAGVAGRHPLYLRAPVWSIRMLAAVSEVLMVTPLVARAQALMLAEGVDEAAPATPELPPELRPARRFDEARIRAALPEGRFTIRDMRMCRARAPRVRTV